MLLDDIVGPMSIEEHIGKVKGGYRLYSHKGKNLGTFPNKTGAEKHEREVQYFKHTDESTELNELDLLAPRSTYFKMGDGAWIKADYRGTQGLTGHTSNDATAFSSFEWVPAQTASSLGLEKKLTQPNSLGQSDPNQIVPDTNYQGNGPLDTRSSDVVDFTTAKSDAVPASLKSKLVNWVHANPPKSAPAPAIPPSQQVAQNQQASVTEQLSDASPITGAITRRILKQRLDLLTQYGPELVGAAIDNVADYVGDVDEIGSSDISAWVAQVERMLRDNPPEAFAEGSVAKKPQPYNDPNWVKNLPKEKLDALAGPRYKKDKKEQGVAEGLNDTIYPNAEVIKSRNGKPVGEIYQDENGWGCFHYKADNGADGMSDREEALAQLKDMHNERRPQGVAEGSLNELSKDTLKSYAKKSVPDMQASQKRSEIEAGKAASAKDDKTAKTHYDAAKQASDRTEKRMAGISGAIKRVTKQDVEEGLNRAFNNPELKDTPKKTDEDNYYNNRTGFRKPSADVTGEGEPQGMFMVVINGRDWKEFTSNKAFTVAKTVAAKNPTKQVQVRWPTGQLNTIKEGMSESDISGLMAASRLHKEFVVKTDTKSYQVQAQSANVAKEKVIKKFPGATIVSVKEKNTEATLQENESDAVYGAILRRIMGAHLSLLSNYGPEAVMNATEEVADWVGDVDEIGTSDVSGWVRDVFNKLQAEYPVQESHSDDEYDDEEQDSELYSGCYVRDSLDGDHGEIFRMQGQPEERRVQILDRDGRGWYISPGRLAKVDDNDPAIAKYFAEDSWHAEDNAWHGGGNEAVDAWHGQSSAGPMAETEEPKKETPKTVAKTWDQMTSKEKLSGVKGRTMYNQKTSKYYVVFDVPATGK